MFSLTLGHLAVSLAKLEQTTNMDTIIWTIGWPIALDLCDFLTVKKEVLQGKDPKGISKEAEDVAGVIWLLGITLTMIC